MASQSKTVEKEESSDKKRIPDAEFSESDTEKADDDDDAKSHDPRRRVLRPQDDAMESDQVKQDESFEDSESDDGNGDENGDENDDDDVFPPCYPANPFVPEQIPFVVYPDDVTRSTPSERNLQFNRMVQNNFVPFSKGLKGEAYRRRTDYEHQQIMGYVFSIFELDN